MPSMKLLISGPAETKEVSLDPKGMTVGRGFDCDVVLESPNVSRQHARISQDPFGRWIIEDLNSNNGIMINGERVHAQAITPYQPIEIRPFKLHLTQPSVSQEASPVRACLHVLDEAVVSYGEDKRQALSPVLIQDLNVLSTSLHSLTQPADLYPAACRCLAELLNSLVAVVRVPESAQTLPKSPEILACHFGANNPDAPTDPDAYVHLSRRVLEAVRSAEAPVMATSGSDSDGTGGLELTIVDTHKPHTVFAVRVNQVSESIDVLYIDMLTSQAPEAMLDFAEVVAGQINAAQKGLYLIELEKQEQALREANNQLREKDKIKDEYVSRITHDIKGHLGAISSCLFVVDGEVTETSSDNLTEFLGRATKRTEKCITFVKELLSLTRMRLSGHIEMAPFSLADSLERAVADVRDWAAQKSIMLTCDIDPAIDTIVGNALSIHEVLANLISNAVKYTPEQKRVSIRAQAEPEAVRIEVSDTGIGIPQKDIEHLFSEFFRATNAREGKEEGTGLGLSIVKQIVDGHQGSIHVDSQEGQGSTFAVVLPLQPTHD